MSTRRTPLTLVVLGCALFLSPVVLTLAGVRSGGMRVGLPILAGVGGLVFLAGLVWLLVAVAVRQTVDVPRPARAQRASCCAPL